VKRYELIEHTADLGIHGFGASVSEAFAAVAEGMFSIMASLDTIDIVRCHSIHVKAASLDTLLVEWLSELLAHWESTGEIYRTFDVSIEDVEDHGYRLSGRICGEPLDTAKHRLGTEVKGISYLGLRVESSPGASSVRCIVDV